MEDVDDVLALDLEWRQARHELDEVGGEFNKANKEVGLLMKAGKKEEAMPLMEKVKEIDQRKRRRRRRKRSSRRRRTRRC